MSKLNQVRMVKATRTAHTCEACECEIAPGSAAAYWAGKSEDGEFWSHHRHVDCYEAEQAWNDWADLAWDEYTHLWHFYDEREDTGFVPSRKGTKPADFLPELSAKWPLVLERLEYRERDRAERRRA